MRFRVIDIETTGADPSEIIEIAAVDVVQVGQGWVARPPRSTLFRPTGPISFHAIAIHHLTPAHLPQGAPACRPDLLRDFLHEGEPAQCFVAHNAAFERRHISDEVTFKTPWLCTVKAARAVWPEAPGYSNQVLRYWRGLDLQQEMAMPPHRAGPDAWVTAHILIDLLKERAPGDLLHLQDASPSVRKVPFGRYKGREWTDVPPDYLAWVIAREDMSPAIIERAKAELAERALKAVTES